MKKVISLLLVCVLVIGLAGCGGSGDPAQPQASAAPTETTGVQANSDPLKIGYGRVNITPSQPVHLQGGNYMERLSTVTMDILYATCIAIQEGDQTILLYTIDIKLSVGSFIDPLKAGISARTGVPKENIFHQATHTHSGPAVRYDWDGSAAYMTEFTNYVINAGELAVRDLTEVEGLYAGSVHAEKMAFVRHYLMEDGTYAGSNFGNLNQTAVEHARDGDDELQIVRIDRTGEKKDIILFSFGTHATFNGAITDTKLSADYPSPARNYIENQTGAYSAFFVSAAGDQVCQSKIPGLGLVESRDAYETYGQAMGKYVVDALPTLPSLDFEGVSFINKEIAYPTNKAGLDKTEYNGPYEAQWIVTRKNLPETRSMVLRAIKIGDLGFVSAPYEMFGVNGKYIKENSPFETTFLMTCGDGLTGTPNSYLASHEGFSYNCYEAQVCYYAEGVAEQAAKDFVSILEELKAE